MRKKYVANMENASVAIYLNRKAKKSELLLHFSTHKALKLTGN